MSRERRTFTSAFKSEAASLVFDQGYDCPEAAKSLDVRETAFRRWVAPLQLRCGGVMPTPKVLTPEQQLIHELQARIFVPPTVAEEKLNSMFRNR